MAVYVDDMQADYGRMKMCHMLADTDSELHAMADKIGVARRWHQKPGTPQSHYDICLSKKVLAIGYGAQQITIREAALLCKRKRESLTSNAPHNGTDADLSRPRIGEMMEPTQEQIGNVLTAIAARADAELMALDEADLAAQWYWRWEEGRGIEWNTYKFSDALEMHKRQCRRWEERHNGSCCVVERVSDKYVMPRVREFLAALAAHNANVTGLAPAQENDTGNCDRKG